MILEYWIYIWVNYNDLTATSLESWLIREIMPKWPQFRLVKYYNLPRYTYIYIYSILLFVYVVQVWLRSWVMQSLYANMPPKWAKHFSVFFLYFATLFQKKNNTSDHIRI